MTDTRLEVPFVAADVADVSFSCTKAGVEDGYYDLTVYLNNGSKPFKHFERFTLAEREAVLARANNMVDVLKKAADANSVC